MRRALLLLAVIVLLLAACGGTAGAPPDSPQAVATPLFDDFGLVGRPQNRNGIGDVDAAFARYEDSRRELIALYRAQPWFQDGLSRDEALFVERGLSFVARYDGPRYAQIDRATIERKLYAYEKVPMSQGDVELLLIYQSGQDSQRQMSMMRMMLPVLEQTMGVQFPERVLTVVNGPFEINDFNDGQFIRIATCCVTSPFILAHELAHAYWSMGPSWLNEGMADIYATFVLEKLNEEAPPGWRRVTANIEAYHNQKRAAVQSGRFPDLVLPRRLASDGLYEAADVFLLDIRERIGAQAFADAAREIYLTSDFGRYILREKRVQDIFLRHTGAKEREAVMALFNRNIWGDNGERYQQLVDREGS